MSQSAIIITSPRSHRRMWLRAWSSWKIAHDGDDDDGDGGCDGDGGGDSDGDGDGNDDDDGDGDIDDGGSTLDGLSRKPAAEDIFSTPMLGDLLILLLGGPTQVAGSPIQSNPGEK